MFEFPDTDLNLAKLVAEIAKELDPNTFIIRLPEINVDSLVDSLIEQTLATEDEHVRAEIKKSLLDERRKEAESKAIEKQKRENLKEQIRESLGYDAIACYKKAYELCGDIDNYVASEIRYSMYAHIESLNDNEKLEICKKRLSYISNPKYGQYKYGDSERAQVLERIGRIQERIIEKLISDGESVDESMPLEILDYYERALRADSSVYRISSIIHFCKKYSLSDKVLYWFDEFVSYFENRNENYGHWGNEIFHTLTEYERFDEAEEFLLKWENQEMMLEAEGKHSQIFLINSYKYMLPYLKKGFKFQFNHVVIDFFDYLKGSKKDVIMKFKNKYTKAIENHRRNLIIIQAYKWSDKEIANTFFDDYLEACKNDIDVIPTILECIDELTEIAEDNGNGIEKPRLYYDKYKTAGCDIFVKLERYYTKNGMFMKAIEVCEKAIACGYLEDGTKSGMIGRMARIQKKMENSVTRIYA